MKDVDDYLKVRHAVRIEGLSERAAARLFGIDPRTVNKMMKFSVPPGYKRKKPPAKPKLDPFIPVIDRILRDDKLQPKKQQHTAKRIMYPSTQSLAPLQTVFGGEFVQEQHGDAMNCYLPRAVKHEFTVDFDAVIIALRAALSLR